MAENPPSYFPRSYFGAYFLTGESAPGAMVAHLSGSAVVSADLSSSGGEVPVSTPTPSPWAAGTVWGGWGRMDGGGGRYTGTPEQQRDYLRALRRHIEDAVASVDSTSSDDAIDAVAKEIKPIAAEVAAIVSTEIPEIDLAPITAAIERLQAKLDKIVAQKAAEQDDEEAIWLMAA